MQTTTCIPVADTVLQGEGSGRRMLGSRCRGCGTHDFPRSLGCRAPQGRDVTTGKFRPAATQEGAR
jgi:hypothetical protein